MRSLASRTGLLALGVMAACPQPKEPSPRKPIAAVRTVRGGVEVRHGYTGSWEPLAVGAMVASGDSVRTSARASAQLDLLGGGTLHIEPAGELVIGAEFERSAAEGSPQVLAVEVGTARFSALMTGAPGEGERVVVLGTNDGTQARVERSGSMGAWGFRVDPTGEAPLISVSTGRLRIKAGGTTREIGRGEAVNMRAGSVGEIVTLPAAPGLVSPAPGALLDCTEPVKLRWVAADGVKRFRVQVTHDQSFDTPVLERSATEETVEFSQDGEGKYSWRVAGVDDHGNTGDFSPPLSFACQPLQREGLLFPVDGSSVREGRPVAFSWQVVPRASQYRLAVTRGLDPSGPVAFELTTGKLVATANLPSGEYLWGAFVEEAGSWRPLFRSLRRLLVRRRATAAAPEQPPTFDTPRQMGWTR